MPYSADLRHSYAKTSINIDWVYQVLTDENIEFEWEENPHNYTRFWFEKHLDEWVDEYIAVKVFGFANKANSYVKYSDSVWEYLLDCIKDWLLTLPTNIPTYAEDLLNYDAIVKVIKGEAETC